MAQNISDAARNRGRPVMSDKEALAMRSHIADCALQLFRQEGYAAISMRRLAEEAGCTVMTIYRYFARKIDVLQALWVAVFNELFDKLDSIAAAETDPVRKLSAVAQGYVDFWLTNREHYFLVYMASGVTQADVRMLVDDKAVMARFRLIPDCLAAVVDNADRELVNFKAEYLLCALNGICHNLITISSYPWSAADRLVQEAIHGILASPVQASSSTSQ